MPVDAVVLLYRPELGRSLKELGFCYPAEGALWLQQVVYWLKKQMGYVMKNGQRYIYNSYADWTKDQITSLSPWEFGKMIRQFRQWGWITTACFAHLMDEFVNPEEVPEEFHPYKTSTWVSLNDKVIESAIGWNPFSEEINTPTGTESLKPAPGAEIANATTGCCNHKDAPLQTPTPSIYKENKTQPNISLEAKEKNYFSGENKIEEVSQDGRVGNRAEYKYSDTPTEKDKHSLPGKDKKSSSQDKFSAPLSAKFKNSEQPNNSRQTLPVKKVEMDRQLYEWEIAQGRPFDVFLRWWADRKYVPQGGRWEADALGNAYSEFYNHPHKTTAVTFPQFIEFMAQVAANSNQARFAGLKVILPSCFKVLPIPTHENVQQLMANIQVLIDDDAQVAQRQEIATPSCNQSISYEQAQDTSIAPLPELMPVDALPPVNNPLTLEEQVKFKQIQWRNVPKLRGVITEWVNKTDCVVLGENGPELAPNFSPDDSEPLVPPTDPEPTATTPLAPPTKDDENLRPDFLFSSSVVAAQKEEQASQDAPAKQDANAPEPDYSKYLEPPEPKDFTPPDSIAQNPSSKPIASTQSPGASQTLSQHPVATSPPEPSGNSCQKAAPPPPAASHPVPPSTTSQPATVFHKVGDRVIWVNAPAHWSSWGALTITDIQDGLVLVDGSNVWIPISELRRADE